MARKRRSIAPESPNSPESLEYGLSKKQLRLCAHHGISPATAVILLNESRSGVMSSIRGNDANRPITQRHFRPAIAKPSDIKAKSSNWGPFRSAVMADEKFGRTVFDPEFNEWRIKKRDKDEVPKKASTVPHEVSLQEIIAGLMRGENGEDSDFELVGAENGRLVFRSKEKEAPPNAERIYFSIDLSQDGKALDEGLDRSKVTATEIPKLKKPAWWDESFGDFDAKADNYFVCQYREGKPLFGDITKASYKDVPVLAWKDEREEFLPVAGDNDLFVIGHSVDDTFRKIIDLYPEAIEPINTKIDDGTDEMIEARYQLFAARYKAKYDQEVPPEKTTEFYKVLKELHNVPKNGVASPLESEFIDMVNIAFEQELPQVARILQHGAEVRNPGKQSPMGKVVFFVDGEMLEKKGPKEISNFMLRCLDKKPPYFFPVNPMWDMEYFGKVIERQIEDGHPVDREALKIYAFYKYYNSKGLPNEEEEIQKVADLMNEALETSLERGEEGKPYPYQFVVGASWDMQIFASVVEKQLAINEKVNYGELPEKYRQEILPQTYANLVVYKRSQEMAGKRSDSFSLSTSTASISFSQSATEEEELKSSSSHRSKR